MLTYIIFGFSYAFAAAVQPGPLQTYLISQTLTKGWKKTLPAAFAPLLSDGPIILVVLFLLSSVSHTMISVLQILGGIFLLYIAFKTWQSFRSFSEGKEEEKSAGAKSLMEATLVNLLNPNPYLGWSLVMGPLLLEGWHEARINGILLLVSFYATLVVMLALFIRIIATVKHLGAKVSKTLLGVSAVILAVLGLYSFWQGMSAF
jgi:threonine/homoserine/homoserine lactone efflux protein